MQTRSISWPYPLAAILGFAVFAAATPALGKEPREQSKDAADEALVEQVKGEVLRQLIEGGDLDAAIEAGIERFVEKQRRARAAAEAREQQETAALAKNVRPVSTERDHVYGNPDAVVSLIEYSDFECPFCKRFHSTAKEVVDAYDGKVNWVYRHFPLASHNPGAQKQAEASECAAALGGNDAFWSYADAIYERTRSNGNGFPLDGLVPLAEELGLDGDAFRRCLDEAHHADRVKEDFDEGVRIGIRGTPGNVLLHNESGQVIPRSGAAPFQVMKQLIDRLLEESS